jgi:ferredoxin
MKTAIYCFTGTGNTLHVARRLSERLGGDVISMARALGAPLDGTYDRAIVVHPTYMYRPPRLVVRFFELLEPGCSVIAVVTHGGDPGGVVRATKAVLAKRGVRLAAAFSVGMPGNYTPFGGPGDEAAVARTLAEADARVDAIAESIVAGSAHVDPPGGSLLRRAVYPGLWYKLGYWAIPMSDQSFWVNESCVGCGSCARVCPVRNITMEGDRPRWNKSCEQCFGCLQWCSKHAIEMGKNTAGVGRYHHPGIARRELIAFQGA